MLVFVSIKITLKFPSFCNVLSPNCYKLLLFQSRLDALKTVYLSYSYIRVCVMDHIPGEHIVSLNQEVARRICFPS